MSNQLTDSCFENIIGITAIECECNSEDRPDDYNVSESGLFIDGLLPMNYAEALADCKNGDIWTVSKNAIADAVLSLKADLFSCIKLNTRLSKPLFKGTITDSTLETIKTMSYAGKDYAGMAMMLGNIKGAKMKINRIGLKFNGTGAIDLTISDNITGDIYSIPNMATQANVLKWNVLATPIEIDCDSGFDFYKMLWMHYETSNGMLPCETKFSCNCGGKFKPSWSIENPQFKSTQVRNEYAWTNYMMAAGISGNDLNDKENWHANQKFSFGIVLDVVFTCDMEKSICDSEKDFSTDPVFITMAHALRFKTCANIIDKILRSGKPSHFTTVAGSQLVADKEAFTNEYNNRVLNFLCPEMSGEITRYSDCFTCKDAWELSKISIKK